MTQGEPVHFLKFFVDVEVSLVPYNIESWRVCPNEHIPIIARLAYAFSPLKQVSRPLSHWHVVPVSVHRRGVNAHAFQGFKNDVDAVRFTVDIGCAD